jgi:hypothetical protein
MGAGCSDPKRIRSLHRDGYRARDGLATDPELRRSQKNANTSDRVGLQELRQGSEQPVFRVRPRLLADRSRRDNVNAH